MPNMIVNSSVLTRANSTVAAPLSHALGCLPLGLTLLIKRHTSTYRDERNNIGLAVS